MGLRELSRQGVRAGAKVSGASNQLLRDPSRQAVCAGYYPRLPETSRDFPRLPTCVRYRDKVFAQPA